MSGGFFSYALLAALATALLVAAFTDLRRREIDNELNAAIALAAPLWWLLHGYGWSQVGFQLALALGTFVLASLLFLIRQMGGGDLKLLVALALWFTPDSFMQLIVLMAVLGGGASIAMASFNMRRVPGETLRDVLSWAIALAWVWCACAIAFALITHRPLIDGGTIDTVMDVVPEAWAGTWAAVWALGIAALVVVLIFSLGFLHILRRQKSQLPIPYGVAISAAGLWVLGEQALTAARLAGQTG